jgi:hypothetical protein
MPVANATFQPLVYAIESAWLRSSTVEPEVVAMPVLAAHLKEALKVSILRCSTWPRLLTPTIPYLVILSDDDYVDAVSETDYSDLDVSLTAESDSHPLHVADSELADHDDTRSTNCEHGCAPPPRPGSATASLHQSDLKNDYLPKHLCQRDVTRNVRRNIYPQQPPQDWLALLLAPF